MKKYEKPILEVTEIKVDQILTDSFDTNPDDEDNFING